MGNPLIEMADSIYKPPKVKKPGVEDNPLISLADSVYSEPPSTSVDLETKHTLERQQFVDKATQGKPGDYNFGMTPGSFGRAVVTSGYHLYQDLRDMDAEDAINGVVDGVKGIWNTAKSLVGANPDVSIGKAWMQTSKGLLWDSILRPALAPAEITARKAADLFGIEKFDPAQEEDLKLQGALFYGSIGLGKLISSAVDLAKAPNVLKAVSSAKSAEEALGIVEGLDKTALMKLIASPQKAPGIVGNAVKGFSTGALAAAPYGFLTGKSPEERFSLGLQAGMTAGIIGSVVGAVNGAKLQATPENLQARELGLSVFKQKQIDVISDKLMQDPHTMLEYAMKAFSEGDVNNILMDNVKPGEGIIVRDIPRGMGKRKTSPVGLILHETKDGELIGMASNDLSPRQKIQFNKFGFHEGQTVQWAGKDYAIALESLEKGPAFKGVKSPTVKLLDLKTNVVKRTRVPLSELDYSPNYNRIIPDIETAKFKLENPGTVTKDFMDLGFGVEESRKIAELINAGVDSRNTMANDVFARAGMQGLYVRETPSGAYQLIEHSTNKPLVTDVKSLSDLKTAVDNFGGVVGDELISLDKPEYNKFDMTGLPGATGDFTHQNWVQRKLDIFRISTPEWFRGKRELSQAYENLTGVRAWSEGVMPFDTKLRALWNEAHPYKQELGKIDADLLRHVPKDRRELIYQYLSTASAEDRMSPDVGRRHFQNRALNSHEIALGQDLSTIDGGVTGLEKTLSTLYEAKVHFDAQTKAGKNVDYADLIQHIAQQNKLSENQVRNLNILVGLEQTVKKEDIHLGAVTELAKSILTKEQSKSDFAKTVGLTKEELKIAGNIQTYLNKLGDYFEIDPAERLTHYMPRIFDRSQYQTAPRYIQTLMDGDVSVDPTFAHSLTRMGLGYKYLTDPVDALNSYVNKGIVKNKLAGTYNKFSNFIEKSAVEVEGKYPGAGEAYKSIMYTHLREAMHVPDASERALKAFGIEHAEKLTGVSKTTAERLVNKFMGLASFVTQGFNPIQGVRDAVSWINSYFMFLGGEETRKAINLALAADDFIASKLHREGKLPGELQRIYISDDATRDLSGPGLKPLSGRQYVQLKEKVGQEAFNWSMQARVYELMHRGTVLERTQTVFSAFEKFRQSKNRAQFERDVKLQAYTPADVNKFNSLIDEGNIKGAADYLAVATSHGISGLYGMATHPVGWGGWKGRLFSQYGQWPSWMMNVLTTQLTGPQGLKVAAKMTAVAGGMMAAGAVTGANLNSWVLAPQNLVYMGGPVTEGLLSLGQSVQRGNSTDFLNKYLPTTSLKQLYIPVPFAAWNLVAAMGVYDIAGLRVVPETEQEVLEGSMFNRILKAINISSTPWNQSILPLPLPGPTMPVNQSAVDRGRGVVPNPLLQ